MEDMSVDFRHLDLPVGLIPSADEVNTDVTQAGDDQEPKQLAVCDVPFDAVEDVFCQINEEENIEDLFDGVLKKCEREQEPVGIPHLFQSISQLSPCVVSFFLFHKEQLLPFEKYVLSYHEYPREKHFLYCVDNQFAE
jgi:hypothetical protein